VTDAPAILVRDLHRSYGAVEAVRGISFEVARGEVFGLLGPNGAGKTTTVEILEGYRARTSGIASVLGHDPAGRPRALRERVGIVLQSSGMYRHLTVREAVVHWAGLYPHPRDPMEVVELAGLQDSADVRIRRLSGGQARRLDLALALVGDPDLLFLDEPTTGFDPSARRQAWTTIKDLCALGKTVFLTTHYMDEAQALADRVAIIAAGRIVAHGTPDSLGQRGTAASTVRFSLPAGGELPDGFDARRTAGGYELETPQPTRLLHELTTWALSADVELLGLEVSRPSLEDVYLALTDEAAAA
jgi:ABC-2 type transport system ATP-binding protein